MGKIWRISGPIVIAEDMKGSQVYEVVRIGNEELIGEIIGLEGDYATVQVCMKIQQSFRLVNR